MTFSKHVRNFFYLILLSICTGLISCEKDVKSSTAEQRLSGVKDNTTLSSSGIGGFDFSNQFDKVFAFDAEGSGKLDYLVCYRPGSKVMFVVKHDPVTGAFISAQFRNGLLSYDLGDYHDVLMAYDYEHSGKQNYLLVYRPSKKLCSIFKYNYTSGTSGTLTQVFSSTNGIGGFDLSQEQDRIFAYDHEGSGKMDYLVVYRSNVGLPGTKGTIWILKNLNTGNPATNFQPVYTSSNGISGYDISDPSQTKNDYGIAFDYDHSGKNDHMIFHCNYVTANNPAHDYGAVIINNGGTPIKIFNFDIWDYQATLQTYRANNLAFDFDHTGKSDYLLQYYPGLGSFNVYKNNNNNTDLQHLIAQQGVGGFDLSVGSDKMIGFDYDHTGKSDYLVVYRPGSGAFWIIQHKPDGTWFKVF